MPLFYIQRITSTAAIEPEPPSKTSTNMKKVWHIRDHWVFNAVVSPVGSESPGERYNIVLNGFHSK
jgi:hypothetical protein